MQEWLNSQTALNRIQLHSEQTTRLKTQLRAIQDNMKEQKDFWSRFEQMCDTEFYLRDLLSLVQLINSQITELKFKLQKKIKDFDNKQFIVPKFNEKPIYLEGHNIHVYSVDISADSKFFISGTINGVVGLWNLHTMQLLKQLKDQKGALFSVAYSRDQRYVASGSSDNLILQWDLSNIYDKTMDYRHDGFVRSIKFTWDSAYLVSGSDDGSVRIWGVKDKTKDNVHIRKMEGHTSHVYGVSVSHDMKYISSIGNDNQIIIWNFQDGEQIIKWIAHENGGCCVEYSHDSTLLVSCGYDCLIKVWNPINGEMIITLIGHSKMVWSVTFSEDSMFVGSASRDGTVRIWNILNGQQLQCLHIVGGDNGFPVVRFSNDMKCVLATGNEKNIRLYKRE